MADVFTLLETDHRHAEQLLELLSSSEPGNERKTVVGELVASLEVHMRFEEQQVYPLLRKLDEEMEREAETEHTLARDGLAKLQELVEAPGFGAAVDMLQGGIGHHVDDEEHEAFPKLRAACDDDQLVDLAARLMAEKRSAAVLSAELKLSTKEQLVEMARVIGVEGHSKMSADELRETLASM
jgi:iron-sulfur cluster repair protein YtfE (RIC family)